MRYSVINILLCDTYPGLLPESIPSHESMFYNLFRPVNPGLTFNIYRVMDGELPEQFDPDALYIIPGSNNAAYDDLPWIFALQDWIRKAAARKVPPCRHLLRAPAHRAGVGRTGGALCRRLGRGHPRDGGFGCGLASLFSRQEDAPYRQPPRPGDAIAGRCHPPRHQ